MNIERMNSSTSPHHPACTVIHSRAVTFLLTKMRDKDLPTKEFQMLGDRLMRILGEEALARLPTVVPGKVNSPCGEVLGLVECPGPPVCVVSIVRSGDILQKIGQYASINNQEAVRCLQPGVSVGKILIQRDESKEDKPAVLYYKKLPPNIPDCFVMLVDPMLATAGSALRAIRVLQDSGVSTSRILFLNLVCAPEGLKAMAEAYPEIEIITGAVDSHLNADKYIVPGLGDYGDRYYGTN